MSPLHTACISSGRAKGVARRTAGTALPPLPTCLNHMSPHHATCFRSRHHQPGGPRVCALPLHAIRAVFRNSNDRIGQSRITSDAPPVHLDSGLNTSSLSVGHGLQNRNTLFRFGRCQCTMGRMWTEVIMPDSIYIETNLQCVRAQWQDRTPHPRLHILKDSLNFRVELPCTDLATDVRDSHTVDAPAKASPKLAPMVSDKKPRRRTTTLDRCLNQFRQIIRCRPPTKCLHRNNLPTETIDDCSDLDFLPEHTDLGHVKMPDLVWQFRMPDVIRSRRDSGFLMLLRRLGRTFLKHSPYRSPADLDPRSNDVPSDRPSTKLRLRKRITDLVYQSADTVVQPIPRRAAKKPIGPEFVINSILPVANRVGVYHKSHPGFLGRPAPQPRDLENLSTLGWREIHPLMRRLPLALATEDHKLSLEQRSIVVDGIPLAREPDQRRGMLEHSGSGCDRRTHENGGNIVRHGPHRSIRLAQINTPKAMSAHSGPGIRKLLILQKFMIFKSRFDRTFWTLIRRRTNSWPTPVGGRLEDTKADQLENLVTGQ